MGTIIDFLALHRGKILERHAKFAPAVAVERFGYSYMDIFCVTERYKENSVLFSPRSDAVNRNSFETDLKWIVVRHVMFALSSVSRMLSMFRGTGETGGGAEANNNIPGVFQMKQTASILYLTGGISSCLITLLDVAQKARAFAAEGSTCAEIDKKENLTPLETLDARLRELSKTLKEYEAMAQNYGLIEQHE